MCAIIIGDTDISNDEPVVNEESGNNTEGSEDKSNKQRKSDNTVKAGDLEYKVISVESKDVIKDPMGGEYKPGAGTLYRLRTTQKRL